MYSLRADSGEVDWQVTTGDMVKCTPVCDPASHLVFCGSHDGFLYALHCRVCVDMRKSDSTDICCVGLSDGCVIVFLSQCSLTTSLKHFFCFINSKIDCW